MSDSTVELVIIALSMLGTVAFILGIKKWYRSRPHRFTGYDGLSYTWHPGYRFTDAAGREVKSRDKIEELTLAWDGLHARTAMQVSAIHSVRTFID